ncbi:MAG: FtsQ-type POTRA domain-containing protein [Leptolinea sp.]
MTGFSDIFTQKPRNSALQQAVPRADRNKRPSLLKALFGSSKSEKANKTTHYPVIKPTPGFNSMANKPAISKLNSLSKLFGIKPVQTPLENLQEQLIKEKPHGENGIGRLFRKMHVFQPKQIKMMPPRGTVIPNHPTRGVVMPNRVPSSTVRSINSPIARGSFLGKFNRSSQNVARTVVTTFVKPKPVETIPVPKPKNMKEWMIAFRTNLSSIHLKGNKTAAAHMHTTPIVTRRGAYGIPFHQKTQTKIRRQLYFSLGASGAEIRLPALLFFNPGWRFLSGLLMLASTACMGFMVYAPEFQVTSVEVNGLNRLEPERIQPILDLANRPVILIDADSIKDRVSKVLPELKDIRVAVGFPASITISLGERKPALVWDNNGQVSWVDTEGILIPVQGNGGELLTILSDVPPPVLEINSIKEIFKAYAAAGVQFAPRAKPAVNSNDSVEEPQFPGMQQVEPSVLATAVQLSIMMPAGAQLLYSNKYGFGWNDQLQNMNVYIGQDLSNLDVKINEYSAIMLSLQKDDIKPGLISLEHVHAPFYRLERQ